MYEVEHLINGGDAPLIVDGDVEPGWAARHAALGAFAGVGRDRAAVERIYVHKSIATVFVAELVEAAREFEIGPLADRAHWEKVRSRVRAAVGQGARLIWGGSTTDDGGCHYPPTVLTDCTEEMEIMREETPGPVAAVVAVGSFDEALRRAAASPRGSSAMVLTASTEHASRATKAFVVPARAAHPRGTRAMSGQGETSRSG